MLMNRDDAAIYGPYFRVRHMQKGIIGQQPSLKGEKRDFLQPLCPFRVRVGYCWVEMGVLGVRLVHGGD